MFGSLQARAVQARSLSSAFSLSPPSQRKSQGFEEPPISFTVVPQRKQVDAQDEAVVGDVEYIGAGSLYLALSA